MESEIKSTKKLASIWFNPFKFHADDRPDLQTAERILEFMLNIEGQQKLDLKEILARYEEIALHKELQALPAVPLIVNNILHPLAEAQRSIMVRHWLSAISLCGTVCEVLCNVIWDLHGRTVLIGNGGIRSETDMEKLFGRKYDRMDQSRRLHFLRISGYIDSDTFENLDSVRILRNPYVHFTTNKNEEEKEKDAKQALAKTTKSVKNILGIKWSDGGCRFNPEVLRYLEDNGFVKEVPACIPTVLGIVDEGEGR